MRRVGLALSGGGFRATLYHLGVIRFLRDADILPKITHITSVSGGSILGAHLVLNWDRYCGSDEEFQQAADELLDFIRLDVRNRIVRRFPMGSCVNIVRRWLRLGIARRLTRPGLLESHYKNFLYGDVGLSQLPSQPQLHILATNLSEGCLCSFNSDGLIFQRRVQGQLDRYDRVDVGLATVAMAVTASSAFPGFFPPLELNGWDVGAEKGEFDRQSFTDGGVYDNLGIRMFHCIEQSWVQAIAPLRKADFLELDDTATALASADSLPEQAPLRRLREMLDKYDPQHLSQGQDAVVQGLWEVIRSEKLYHEPSFRGMELADKGGESLLRYVQDSGRDPELSDALWLNRQIIASSLQQAVGKPCMQVSRDGFDSIILSDAGGKFKVTTDGRSGSLIKTALRSTDILMDRVWQLELEMFANTPRVLFFPITDVVDRAQDRSAPHPKIQRQAARIRTDLDRFSDLEIAALVQHGYCVARKNCRATRLFDVKLPSGAPWNPCDDDRDDSPVTTMGHDLASEEQALVTARTLQRSTLRRTWSTLFDLKDWPSYVWIAILLIIACSAPYLVYKNNYHAARQQMVLQAISQSSPLYGRLLDLLENGSVESIGEAEATVVDSLPPMNFEGYHVLSDTRIYDLRAWADPNDEHAKIYVHERIRIRREEQATNTELTWLINSRDESLPVVCHTKRLDPRLSKLREPNEDGSRTWGLTIDFSHVPLGDDAEAVLDGFVSSEGAELIGDEGRFHFSVAAPTSLVHIWMLLPENRGYEYFEISGHPIGKPELTESVNPSTKVNLPFGAIATFRLINPEANYRYECRWRWSGQQP